MKLRWLITRQLWSLWQALMLANAYDSAEFMSGITPQITRLHERARMQMECIQQRIANRESQRRAYQEAMRAAQVAKAKETARERGGTI